MQNRVGSACLLLESGDSEVPHRRDDCITDAEREQRLVAWLQLTAAESEFRAIRALFD
jgi:hypothetical protein